MRSWVSFKSLWIAALLGIALVQVPLASASTLSYNLTTCFFSCGTGPYGTVAVSSLSSTEVSVNLTLASGEVFATSGSGKTLLFDLQGNPSISVTNLTSGFAATSTASGQSLHADGTGTWQYWISCTLCGNGTSPPRDSGPVNFDVTVASGITPASFIENGYPLYFASDIGVPNGSGYNTGDVGATSPVPLPATAWLLGSGLMVLAGTVRKRKPS